MSLFDIASKNKGPFLVFAIMCISIIIRYLTSNGKNIYVDYDFLDLSIKSKIHIYKYNHGLPLVSILNDERKMPFILPVPMGCSVYIRTGDSLVKYKGINSLKVVRDSSGFRVITTWSSFQNPSLSQLTLREVHELH